ncbi:MAG: Ribosomal large subunit pseudouridine synthase [Myxococcaceae bacterium]|nr:Ribosomal large subunit pseudouridine synthase [Myxococcaceae bacterium]
MPEERLQKILARAGVASRRAAEQLITGGRVTVNGELVTELGARADTETDRIEVDGQPVAREEHVYYLIHKPRGMVTTMKDPEDRPSLSELLHKIPERIYPVGRLDFHTSGALILTNDGDLAQALLHPSRAVPKTYVVKVNVEVGESMLNALERGVVLDDGYRTQPARVEHIRDEEGKSWIQITITEGKNRQIHRMIESLGARVNRLSRVSFAGLSTEDLRPGDIRALSEREVLELRREYLSDTKAAARQPKRMTTHDRMRERLGTSGNSSEQARAQRPSSTQRDRRSVGQAKAMAPSTTGSVPGAADERARRNERAPAKKTPTRS